MYARSTSIRARQESVEAGLGFVRDEVMPTLAEMDGCVGLSMLIDRHGGRCIATSAWHDQEAMQASGQRLRPIRERFARVLGGGRLDVEEWEIGLLHRDHTTGPGACARATWVQVAPAGLDRAFEVFRMTALPALEGLDGFCSASLMLNRIAGRTVSTVTFDSQDAMERSRVRAAEIREAATREAGASVLDVCEFELALAHLRVPEMA